MIVDGYVRVSRVGERSGESFISPSEQKKLIEAYVKAKGLTIGMIFEELDESGGNSKRPKWNQAIERVERGQSKGVVVSKLDRFSRSVLDGLTMIDRMEKAGGRLYAAADDFDTSTPTGKFTLNMMFSMAEMERLRAQDNFAASTRNAIERGVYVGKTPLGYINGEDGRLVVDPETAPFVEELFKRRAKGESWSALNRWMADQGRPRSRAGLMGLIQNVAYLGHARNGKLLNEQAHESIIDRVLFDQANVARGIPPKHNGRFAGKTMLQGLAECSGCGRKLLVNTRQGKNLPNGKREKLPCYTCRGDSAAGRCEHRSYADSAELDTYVEQYVLDAFDGHGPVAEAVEATEKVEEAVRAVAEAEYNLNAVLTNAKLISTLGEDDFTKLVETHKSAVELARLALAEVKGQSEMIGDFEGSMLKAWPSLSALDKRRLLFGFIERVMVRPSKGGTVSIEDRVTIVWKGGITLDGNETTAGMEVTKEVDPGELSSVVNFPRNHGHSEAAGPVSNDV